MSHAVAIDDRLLDDRVLRGEFVNLRPLEVADAELTLGWRSGDRARYLNDGAQTVAQQAAWIAGRPDTEFNYVIELVDGRPVGMLSLYAIDPVSRRGEPGRFLIGDEAAVQGIPAAVEATKLLYGLAFDRLGLVRLCGIAAAENTLVIKWQKFMGMREEGRLRNHLCLGGRFQDGIYMGLLVDDYRTTTLPRMNALIAAARNR
jgi:diamine N-acetyltransferase